MDLEFYLKDAWWDSDGIKDEKKGPFIKPLFNNPIQRRQVSI
jgi:hypothetical protein